MLIRDNITSSTERGSDGKATGKRSVKEGGTKTKSNTAILDINQKAIDITDEKTGQSRTGH